MLPRKRGLRWRARLQANQKQRLWIGSTTRLEPKELYLPREAMYSIFTAGDALQRLEWSGRQRRGGM